MASSVSFLKLFVYGTLKRGYSNHRRFCQGVLNVEPASVRGRLHVLPAGYPMLSVQDASTLAQGSHDVHADLAEQMRWTNDWGDLLPAPIDQADGWDVVYGEILTFDDPTLRLPKLDRLEGFRPGRRSLYRRVLLPVEVEATGATVVAWTYVGKPLAGRYLPGGRWPA